MISYRAFQCASWLMFALWGLYVMLVFIPGSAYLSDNSVGEPAPPVAYRVLVRGIGKTVHAMIPDGLAEQAADGLSTMYETPLVRRLLRLDKVPYLPHTLEREQVVFTTVMILQCYGWLMAFIGMLRMLSSAFFSGSKACGVMVPALFLWLLPVFFSRYAYSYDFAELFFACACFYLLYRQHWGAYLLVFALATLVKETSVFSALFFAAWFVFRLPRQLFLRLLVSQLAIYGLLEMIIVSRFSYVDATHGGQGLDHFINIILDHLNYMWSYNMYSVMSGIGMLVLVAYRWQEKPAFLLGGLWLVAINLLVYFVNCNDGEYRDLFWSMPVVVLLAAHSIVRLLDMDRWPVFAGIRPPGRKE